MGRFHEDTYPAQPQALGFASQRQAGGLVVSVNPFLSRRQFMGTIRRFALVAVLGSGLCFAHGAEKKSPNQAEVRFLDGSLVRMVILQENIEVMTKYGKLTIPTRDIRRIEFGLHLPEGVGPQIQAAIRQMGSSIYKQREDAVKDLVDLGPLAFSSVQKAALSTDLEVAQRAAAVLKRISASVPAENLRTKMEDFIQTSEFPVIGKIVSPSIKAHSVHFGELTLKLSDLRTLHLRGGNDDAEVVVDAAKHGSAPDQWLDSGTTVDPNLRLSVRCEGQVDLWPQGPGQYMTTAKGYTTAGKGGVHMAGTLLGRVGVNGKVFVIGDSYDGVPTQEGKLFLHIVPSPWNNASTGTYRVRIRTDYVALSSR
jgi:hypothetical protein